MTNELINLFQTENYGEVQETLQFFLEECSLDEIPSREEISQWRDILQQRGGKFSALAQQCQHYLDEIA
ncbi:dioxygenase [Wielerella bovis]|uniref:dioxygenase n=1 Tax=Wielerella bovis TaxID=2917790 RepID=UPI00201852EE|nr:dioxygenase [Wielerella bovis]MCG7657815.1 dioxygenase [Wielerella bovis]MCG7660037.1 dioxygenase [Wielerella bovis]